MAKQTPLFRELNADDGEPETTEIESCCMNCYENVRKTITCKPTAFAPTPKNSFMTRI